MSHHYTVFEAADDLSCVFELIAPIARDGALVEVSRVLVSIFINSCSFPGHVPKFELSFKDAMYVLKEALSVKFASFEVSLV
jgi:hypothetical protein